ncbi:MAG: hypothetical protein MUE85_21130 [Microscillaceae bacterium]|jgi:hypothetical protein|nr:hypothetical protein [Microscillaceae bacterium]
MQDIGIVTSMCVDIEPDEKVLYPQLKDVNAQDRRWLYWQCVYVFFATSKRFNPSSRHILYTNEQAQVVKNGLDLLAKIKELGVEVKFHQFQHFNPPKGYSNTFKNAFYKMDVIKELGKEEGNFILLDSDCVWIKPVSTLNTMMDWEKEILLYDTFTSTDPAKRDPKITKDNLYKSEVGKVFKQIDENYPFAEPHVFGGEVIGGNAQNLKIVAEELDKSFYHILTKYKSEAELPRFPNGKNIFSGMEYWTSMIYNQMPLPYRDARAHIRRIWTAFRVSSVKKSDFDLTIWHMPAEKKQGFPNLFQQMLKPQSKFWTLPLDKLPVYMGEYLGITDKTINFKRLGILVDKVQSETMKFFKKKK